MMWSSSPRVGRPTPNLVALDEALVTLARIDPRKAQIVEMRFFGGLTVEEIGDALKVSTGTIKRDWRAAKAWLYRELSDEPGDGRGTLEAG
jgi:RNA polymerase sigma-70 factor (ECF subfamily)